MKFKVLTYNIHKGFNALNQWAFNRIEKDIRDTDADIICLQEVLGLHTKLEKKIIGWPQNNQAEHLAKAMNYSHYYSQNAEFHQDNKLFRHHGNAILSRWPLKHVRKVQMNLNAYEQRALIDAEVHIDHRRIHIMTSHLNLFHRDRVLQYKVIADHLAEINKEGQSVILCGDFNDWSQKADDYLTPCQMEDAYQKVHGVKAKTFPTRLPMLKLDRVYSKNLTVHQATVLNCRNSDHLPILVEFEIDQRD